MAIPRTQRPFFLPLLFSLPPQVQKMTFWQPHKCFSGSAHISQETGFSCRVKGKKKRSTNKTSDTVAMTHQRQDECAGEDTPHKEKGGQEAGRAAERARRHVLGSDGHQNSSGTSELCQLSCCQTLCHVSDSWGTGEKSIWEIRGEGCLPRLGGRGKLPAAPAPLHVPPSSELLKPDPGAAEQKGRWYHTPYL